jgi:hypothetical protein
VTVVPEGFEIGVESVLVMPLVAAAADVEMIPIAVAANNR